ncbi:unnamed protein product [Xylocopa violacea]|uniref:Uncharacterized protein n=1 Tax=Xylocopa violacea TaxID=135666 RepID=A0ABP1NGE3_XYLVO
MLELIFIQYIFIQIVQCALWDRHLFFRLHDLNNNFSTRRVPAPQNTSSMDNNCTRLSRNERLSSATIISMEKKKKKATRRSGGEQKKGARHWWTRRRKGYLATWRRRSRLAARRRPARSRIERYRPTSYARETNASPRAVSSILLVDSRALAAAALLDARHADRRRVSLASRSPDQLCRPPEPPPTINLLPLARLLPSGIRLFCSYLAGPSSRQRFDRPEHSYLYYNA